jgi:DNA-binding response OmpR family regulator
MRILLIEDEQEIAGSLARRLGRSGFIADHVSTIADALDMLESYRYSFVLLDRRLPDGDGVTLLPDMRRLQPKIRVLIITACDTTTDKVLGLDAGADDYLTKPFEFDELMARMRAGLRRSGGDLLPPIKIGAISFDPNLRDISIAGSPVVMQRREAALLEVLLCNAGRMVRRQTLIDEIYGCDDEIQPSALTLLVFRLRRRLDELGAEVDIHSARGVGYMLTRSAT